MTTENIVVLFSDVVGSTALSVSHTPDDADDLRRRYFSVLRQAVTEAGGTEVKNLGDGLMVVFASASAALSCAVAMQQGVDHDNRGREHKVGLRVGLSGGEVTREEDDYFGDPVVEASRLCAGCRSGQILAADVVRAMAGRRSRHRSIERPAMLLKGLPEAVEVVEVEWEPLDEGLDQAVPLPTRLAVRPSVAVVGHEVTAALAVINDTLKRVSHGQGREVVLVSGEAGVGKTTLVAEAARPAFGDRACVLFGHSEEDLSSPYQMFAEAVSHFVTHASDQQLAAHVATHGSELARLTPALASRLPGLAPPTDSDADTERYLLFAAVVGLLSMASEHQPVVLVLDDLQWADKGSLLLLRHLVSAERPMRVLVLGTYRDSELSHANDLLETLAALHRQPGVSRVELTGLDDNGVVSLMEAAAGQVLDESGVRLAHAVHRETDGNPFFVIEVLRHLTETGVIVQGADGAWAASERLEDATLPASVRVVIGSRVVRLGDTAQRVLSTAAVIGQAFDLDLLAAATHLPEDELLDVLDTTVAADLVREMDDLPGRYRFTHALIRRTLYEDMGPARRSRAHRVVGEALEELVGDRPGTRVGELAHHWFSATQPVEVTKAIDYSALAARAALAALAPDEAVRYFNQALQLLAHLPEPDPLVHIDLLIGLGTAQRQSGVSGYRETLLDAARRARDRVQTDRLVEAALANNRGLFSSLGVVDGERVEILEAALDQMPTDDSGERALLLATLANELTHGRPLADRRDLADAAITMARRVGDPTTLVRVFNLVEQALEVPQTLPERVANATEALALAEGLDDPSHLYFAAVYRRISALQSADGQVADECLATMRSLADRLRQPILLWITGFHEAASALTAGRSVEAEVLATAALEIGTESGQPDALSFYGTQVMISHHQQGTLGELLPVVLSVASETSLPGYDGATAVTYLEAGQPDQARAIVETAAAERFTTMPVSIGWLEGNLSYAEVAVELRDERLAGLLLELLAPFHDQIGFNGLIAFEPVAMYLGGLATVVGRYEEAATYFEEADRLSRGLDSAFFLARTELAWGRMLLARGGPGDRALGVEKLGSARAAGVAHGYGGITRRAAEAMGIGA